VLLIYSLQQSTGKCNTICTMATHAYMCTGK